MADFTDLDWLFECPPSITDDGLRAGWELLLNRYKQDTVHLPASTAQLTRIKIIMRYTVLISQMERKPYGEPGGFANPGHEKEANAFLANLLKDLDDVLHKNRPTGADLTERAKVTAAVSEVLRTIEDPAMRMELVKRAADTFDRYGI